MGERIVLAYSGGLDTTVAVRWLQEARGFEVVTLTVDLGSQPDLEAIRRRALASGAVEAVVVDARAEFVSEYCWPALKASALYQGQYPLATALGRPLITRHLVETARRVGAGWIAHGSTGKGNDQVRFDIAAAALEPELKVLAPLRDGMTMTREEEIAYAHAHGLPTTVTQASPYSIDENLWGRSIEAGVLEDPSVSPPEDAFLWTASVDQTPATPLRVALRFESGVPVAIDQAPVDPVLLVDRLNRLGGAHGVGRIDMIEDRVVGIKSREVYEAPAAVILHLAHRALEELVLSAEAARFKVLVAQEYSRLVYEGKWFAAHRYDLDAYVAHTQRFVTGQVEVILHRGTARIAARTAPASLYRPRLATYSAGDTFDHQAAVGFISLVGLPIRTQAQVQGIDATRRPPD
ncbi:MAG TPA: argininosuccinate synthase [Candidatus Limnocylindrales bacterium]|nr:argininosuccinate synthase [Candidatus Limnocylindrales bacterium]